jgi:hypothetical protein
MQWSDLRKQMLAERQLLAIDGEERLIVDARGAMKPSDWVDRKLTALLSRGETLSARSGSSVRPAAPDMTLAMLRANDVATRRDGYDVAAHTVGAPPDRRSASENSANQVSHEGEALPTAAADFTPV